MPPNNKHLDIDRWKPGDEYDDDDEPGSICIHPNGPCSIRCDEGLNWANNKIPAQLRRTLTKPVDRAWKDEPGSPTNAAWRDRTCRRVIHYLGATKYAANWQRLLQEKYPYQTVKGKGLDLIVRKKATQLRNVPYQISSSQEPFES
jgi:hypothetical protein